MHAAACNNHSCKMQRKCLLCCLFWSTNYLLAAVSALTSITHTFFPYNRATTVTSAMTLSCQRRRSCASSTSLDSVPELTTVLTCMISFAVHHMESLFISIDKAVWSSGSEPVFPIKLNLNLWLVSQVKSQAGNIYQCEVA